MKQFENKHSAPLLLWFIPVMVSIVTFVTFLGVSFAAMFQWMRTMKVHRKAAQAYIDRTAAQRTDEMM